MHQLCLAPTLKRLVKSLEASLKVYELVRIFHIVALRRQRFSNFAISLCPSYRPSTDDTLYKSVTGARNFHRSSKPDKCGTELSVREVPTRKQRSDRTFTDSTRVFGRISTFTRSSWIDPLLERITYLTTPLILG